MKEQMIAELENIYADTWDYFDKNKDQDSSLFSKVGTNNLGFAWLYTPPIYKPKLLICGQNPGNFGYHYDDEYDREMLKGEIPIINTYTAGRDGISYPFEFAKFIRKHLDKTAERKELLDTNTVGMNIFPFQYKGSATLSGKKNKEHKAFFKKLSIKNKQIHSHSFNKYPIHQVPLFLLTTQQSWIHMTRLLFPHFNHCSRQLLRITRPCIKRR